MNLLFNLAGLKILKQTIQKDFPEEFYQWYSSQSFWSGSYYVSSTGGATIEKLRQYIKNQDSPDS
jgi:putative transposase